MVSESQKMAVAMLLSFGLGFAFFKQAHPSTLVQQPSEQAAVPPGDLSVPVADRAPRAAASDGGLQRGVGVAAKATSVEITVRYGAKPPAKVRLGLSATDAAVKEAIATASGAFLSAASAAAANPASSTQGRSRR